MGWNYFWKMITFFHKVVYPKYSKQWLSTVAHSIDCVCSKILNHVLLFLLFKFFGWKNILNWHENSGLKSRFLFCLIFQFYLMFRLICQKPANFLSAQMDLVSTFFQKFTVLGMYFFVFLRKSFFFKSHILIVWNDKIAKIKVQEMKPNPFIKDFKTIVNYYHRRNNPYCTNRFWFKCLNSST